MDNATKTKYQQVFWLMIQTGDLGYLMSMIPFQTRAKVKDFVNFTWNSVAHHPETTMLQEAIKRSGQCPHGREAEIVRFLIDSGADCRGPENLETAFAYHVHLSVYELLCNAGAQITAGVVIRAIDREASGAHGIMSTILARVTPDAINGSGDNVPLTYAIVRLHHAIACQLLDRGANPNVVDDSGITPLIHALTPNRRGGPNEELVAKLIRRGADVRHQTPRGVSALSTAITTCPRVVRLLLEAGADPNAGAVLVSVTPDMSPDGEIAFNELMRTEGGVLRYNTNVNIANEYGMTPLMVVLDELRARLLLAHGASVVLRSNSGNSALWYAFANGKAGVARAILEVPGVRDTIDVGRVLARVSKQPTSAELCSVAIDAGVEPTPLLRAYLDQNARPDDAILTVMLDRLGALPREVHPHEHGTIVARRRAIYVRNATSNSVMGHIDNTIHPGFYEPNIDQLIQEYIPEDGDPPAARAPRRSNLGN